MKKILIGLLILSIFGCNNKVNIDDNKINDKPNDEVIEYKDINPIILGIYNENRKLINNYSAKFVSKKDITWLSIFPTQEENLTNTESKQIWEDIWKSNIDKGYRFGIELIYTLSNGEKIEQTILKPSDNKYFDYLEVYLYDGYNATTKWFDHLDDEEFNDRTVFTSIKLTGGKLINEIDSNISLRVFTYDTKDDFDINNKYIGNSFTSVIIKEI